MDEPLQARAYAEADFAVSDQAFTHTILALLSAQPSAGSGGGIVDLGCGPGNITFRLADALPQTPVLGLDGAQAMLALAEQRQRLSPGSWSRLHFHHIRFPLSGPEALATLPEPFRPPYGVIVSNSLLHHLHDPAVLWRTIHQLAAPGALVVLRDLRRPPHARALQELVERHATTAPLVLRRDYSHSLAAAFEPGEVRDQLRKAGLSTLRVAPLDDRYLEVWGWLPA